MTNLIMPDVPEEPRGPEAAQPVDETPPPAAPTASDEVPFESLPQFWQDEITRKRDAEAGYRTKLRSYEEAFEPYDDDSREAVLAYVRLSALAEQGDPEAASQLQEMFGGEEDASALPAQTPSPPEPVDYRAIAREEAERVAHERDQARQQQDGIDAIRKAGEDAGFSFGSEDYILFVRGANEFVNAGQDGDPIEAGKQAVAQYHQAIVEQYLASKGQQADSTTQIPSGAGAAPNLAQKPWTDDMSEKARFAAVANSALERMRANQ